MDNKLIKKLENWSNISSGPRSRDGYKCIYCERKSLQKLSDPYNEFPAIWYCKYCADKNEYKTGDIVWFYVYKKKLDKYIKVRGKIIDTTFSYYKTYKIEVTNYNRLKNKKALNLTYNRYYKFIYKTEAECDNAIQKFGVLASDIEVSDMLISYEQNKLYNMIKKFLQSDEAVQFNITGMDIRIEDSNVNCYWKYGSRSKNDIKE